MDGKISMVSVSRLLYKMPADGLPPLPAWKAVAQEVYSMGFEPLREPFEVCDSGTGGTVTW